jgi:hypothetical protein
VKASHGKRRKTQEGGKTSIPQAGLTSLPDLFTHNLEIGRTTHLPTYLLHRSKRMMRLSRERRGRELWWRSPARC